MTGALTMLSQFILIRHEMWIVAMALTLAYVAFGVGLLIKTDREERKRKILEAENRDKVFSEWLEFTKMKGANK